MKDEITEYFQSVICLQTVYVCFSLQQHRITVRITSIINVIKTMKLRKILSQLSIIRDHIMDKEFIIGYWTECCKICP